jgi:3-hydroxyisobutyrate dehydrogenase
MATAKEAEVYTPMGQQAESLYDVFNRSGGSQLDFSGVIKLLSGELKAVEAQD